jgi:nucleoside-diphosphate-sugar epimerase
MYDPALASDRDVAQIMKEFIPEVLITIRKGGISRRVLSRQFARDELGWKPTYDLKSVINTI